MTIKHWDGTSERRSFYGATKNECKLKADSAQNLAGKIVDSGRTTLGSWLSSWVASLILTGRLAPRTIEFYEGHCLRYIAPRLGQIELATLTTWQVQYWVDELIADGLGVPTAKGARATLRVALNRAKALRLVSENAAVGAIEFPPHTVVQARRLEPNPMNAFMQAALQQAFGGKDHFECAEGTLLAFAAQSGVRNEELIGLTWEHVHFEPNGIGGEVEICQVLQRVRDSSAAPRLHSNGRTINPRKFFVGPPKTNAGHRPIELFPEVADALRAEKDRQRMAGWKPLEVGDLVFRTRYGKPLSDVYLNQRMKRMCKQVGIEYRSFYALRHSIASRMHHEGESDVSIAEMLGHRDPATSRSHYIHQLDASRAPRMEKLRRAMLGEGSEPTSTGMDSLPGDDSADGV